MSVSNKKSIDMTSGALWNKILLFALPLAASSILQQLFNSVDTAVVGRFASSQALAAVGSNSSLISLIAFFCFQVFPRQIISVFGNGSELYFQFSERYFRIYMFLTLINGIQPVTSNFFNSIGKSSLGVLLSLTRQILFLLPLIVIFPIFMGIDGVMYAGPIADAAAAIVCGYFTIRELKELTAKDKASNYPTKKITYN